jgi:hypothetical protein
MAVTSREVGHDLVGAGDVGLADVEQDQHRLVGQQAKATDALLLVIGQLDVTHGGALAQGGSKSFEGGQLALVLFAFGGCAMAAAGGQLLYSLVDDGKVGQHELEVEPLDIAPRIDRPLGMANGGILKCTHDVEQLIGGAQLGQLIGRDLGRFAAVGAERRRG